MGGFGKRPTAAFAGTGHAEYRPKGARLGCKLRAMSAEPAAVH